MRIVIVAFLCILATAPSAQTDPPSGSVSADDLVATWKVDLHPTPGADPYFQELVVESVEDGVPAGEFYGTKIESARVNTDWGAVHFAFVTRDGSGAYHHAGVLRDGRIEGTTLSIGRGFLAVWTASRAE